MFKCVCENCGPLELVVILRNCPYCGVEVFDPVSTDYQVGWRRGFEAAKRYWGRIRE